MRIDHLTLVYLSRISDTFDKNSNTIVQLIFDRPSSFTFESIHTDAVETNTSMPPTSVQMKFDVWMEHTFMSHTYLLTLNFTCSNRKIVARQSIFTSYRRTTTTTTTGGNRTPLSLSLSPSIRDWVWRGALSSASCLDDGQSPMWEITLK